MSTLTQLISIQAFAPLIAVVLVGSITLHAYWKYKKQNKPCLLPNTCQLLQREIYLLNQEIDETTNTDKLKELTHKLLNLEEHLMSLQDYDIKNYPSFDLGVAAIWILILGGVVWLICVSTILIF